MHFDGIKGENAVDKGISLLYSLFYEQRRSLNVSTTLNDRLFLFYFYGCETMLKKEGEIRIPSGCAISGLISKKGNKTCGDKIVKSMTVMHERSNGLGGGFAGYGIYPEFKDLYALHIFYDNTACRHECEKLIGEAFEIEKQSEIPVRETPKITNQPLIWRYFAAPNQERLKESQLDEKEYVARIVIKINKELDGCYVFSSGKNMGVFKAVGFPEDVGEFYRLEEYEGYSWTAHGRYPTNTPGWWGGAHPFALLDYSIVHNGEISSYDANRRFIEMFGYACTLKTDTEVITYIFDYLLRKQGMTLEEAASVIAAPFWSVIDTMPPAEKQKMSFLRNTFGSLLVTGPFSILLGYEGGLLALNDRLKLRSMVCAEKDDMTYFASEECAIRVMEPNPTRIWAPSGGEAVIANLEGGVN